jgi:glycosyltransferase involved in cell wall biosynthesis
MKIIPFFGRKKPAHAKFHIITPTADVADAVTNDALGMCDVLRRAGFRAVAYAENIAASLRGAVLPISEYERSGASAREDVLIYHHSFGWSRGESLYANTRNKKILKYHNITPAEFFSGYSETLSAAAEAGRNQTSRLVKVGADLCLGDSTFNTRELLAAGADPSRSHSLAPFHQAEQLLSVDPDIEAVKRALDGNINILFVGRLAPNKGHLSVLRTIAYFRRYVEPNTRLVLVGKINPELASYGEEVWAAISDLDLEHAVVMLPHASHAQLRALYLTSHAFLCLSEHEGFGVPLIEAMLHKIPIVALSNTAIPETLGPAGLMTDRMDEVLLAEMIAYCIERKDFRSWLAETQFARYEEHFTNDAIAARFLKLVSGQVN